MMTNEEIEQRAIELYPAVVPYPSASNFRAVQQREAYITGYKQASREGWVSVEDAPLFINTPIGWECTEAGMKELLVAVPYANKNQLGEELWWIKHCVFEDEKGLCVVGDDDNEPAGWDMKDVTHYKILDLTPPKTKL